MGQPNPTQTVTNPRIAKLIELETAGRIKPEHQTELDTYRAQGWAPKKMGGPSATTEAEKTAAFLATRVAGGMDDLSRVIDKTPSAASPELDSELFGFNPGMRNFFNSGPRQQVEAAQNDVLDAALTLGTGAAYTKEQLAGYRESYFPQYWDTEDTIADKEVRLRRLLESAKVKAGGAAPQIDQALAKVAALSARSQGLDKAAPDQKKQEMLGTLVPLDVAKKLEEGGLTDEQKAAYDAFNRANPNATADQLRSFAASIGMADLENAEDIVKARDEGGGLPAAEGGKIRPPDISDARGRGGFSEGADAAVRGAADTLSLGFADEITAGAKTVFGGGTMDENLARERAIDAYDAENSPWLRGGGQLAGGLLFPVGRGATAPGELAKIGGLTGAGYGFGSGEDMGERVGGAALGGTSGAALGFGAGKLFEKLRPIGGGGPGGNRAVDTARDVSEASADLGIDMLPADAGGPLTRTLTTVARTTPGGAVPITKAAQRSQRQAGDALDKIASREGEVLDAENMGNAVREGALKFRSGSRNSIGRVYDKAAEEAGDARVTPSKAIEALDANIAELSEVPGETEGLPILEKLRADLAKRGTVTVNGLRGMRTQYRQKFAKDNLRGSDIERRVMSVIDAASDDLITSLEAQGKTSAARTYAEADRQWAERIKTLDDVIMPIIGKKGEKSGEQIASALNAAAKGNNARLAKLFETLPEEEAGIARATMIDNLGKAGPGAQNAGGDAFSFNSFLTNWNKLGNSAKNSLFRGENREAIDQFALLADRAKAASKYQNYSNTGLAVMGAATGGTAIASVFTLGKVLAAQYAAGRLLASPKVAKALLKIAQAKNPAAVSARIDALSSVAAREPVLSNEIGQLQQKLMSAMNDNRPISAAASDDDEKKRR